MSVRIASKHLVGLLRDLVLTAPNDIEVFGALAGVLLHSDRADVDALPGKKEKFRLGPIDDYPRSNWFALQQGDQVLTEPVLDRDHGEVPPLPRVDFSPEFLAPFAAIAKRRKANLELYVRHHRRLVHIQIGEHYRGAISPASYPDGPSQRNEGMTPGLQVFDPKLPPRPEPPAKPRRCSGKSKPGPAPLLPGGVE